MAIKHALISKGAEWVQRVAEILRQPLHRGHEAVAWWEELQDGILFKAQATGEGPQSVIKLDATVC